MILLPFSSFSIFLYLHSNICSFILFNEHFLHFWLIRLRLLSQHSKLFTLSTIFFAVFSLSLTITITRPSSCFSLFSFLLLFTSLFLYLFSSSSSFIFFHITFFSPSPLFFSILFLDFFFRLMDECICPLKNSYPELDSSSSSSFSTFFSCFFLLTFLIHFIHNFFPSLQSQFL